MTGTPTVPDVDALAEAVRAEPSPTNFGRLWQSVYALENWWLVPTGDAADPRPMVGVVEERTFLLAFTSDRHVRDFAARQDGPADGDGVAAMSITAADLTRLAPTLAGQGIAGILFDQGVHSFVAPIAGLESMWSQFGGDRTRGPNES